MLVFRIAVILGALIVPISASAQVRLANAEVEAAAEDVSIAEVIASVEKLDAALVSDDRAVFAAVMSPELVVNNPQNGISKPGDAVARNAAGRISYDSYERTIEYAGTRGTFVLLMGGETVVAKGTTERVYRRFTDLWQPTSDGWRLSARQATIVVAPQ